TRPAPAETPGHSADSTLVLFTRRYAAAPHGAATPHGRGAPHRAAAPHGRGTPHRAAAPHRRGTPHRATAPHGRVRSHELRRTPDRRASPHGGVVPHRGGVRGHVDVACAGIVICGGRHSRPIGNIGAVQSSFNVYVSRADRKHVVLIGVGYSSGRIVDAAERGQGFPRRLHQPGFHLIGRELRTLFQ